MRLRPLRELHDDGRRVQRPVSKVLIAQPCFAAADARHLGKALLQGIVEFELRRDDLVQGFALTHVPSVVSTMPCSHPACAHSLISCKASSLARRHCAGASQR